MNKFHYLKNPILVDDLDFDKRLKYFNKKGYKYSNCYKYDYKIKPL